MTALKATPKTCRNNHRNNTGFLLRRLHKNRLHVDASRLPMLVDLLPDPEPDDEEIPVHNKADLVWPDGWSERMFESAAYQMHDVVWCVGARVDFRSWWRRFSPNVEKPSAKRTWERFKKRLALMNVPHVVGCNEIRFRSVREVTAILDSLVGPVDDSLTEEELMEGLEGLEGLYG